MRLVVAHVRIELVTIHVIIGLRYHIEIVFVLVFWHVLVNVGIGF